MRGLKRRDYTPNYEESFAYRRLTSNVEYVRTIRRINRLTKVTEPKTKKKLCSSFQFSNIPNLFFFRFDCTAKTIMNRQGLKNACCCYAQMLFQHFDAKVSQKFAIIVPILPYQISTSDKWLNIESRKIKCYNKRIQIHNSKSGARAFFFFFPEAIYAVQ